MRHSIVEDDMPDNIKQDAGSIRYMSKMIINLGEQDPETSEALRDLIWEAAERIADWEVACEHGRIEQ
jgi:hypothetical protein